MKSKILLILGLMCSFFLMEKVHAQYGIDGVSYKLKYNTDSCWYDVYLVINAGSATTATERIQFNSQLSLVVPTGTTVTIPRGYMPLINNNAALPSYAPSYAPNYWALSSAIYNPAAAPGKDFRAITPNLSSGTAYYDDLAQGDEVKIFSIRTTPLVKCSQDIRLYINGSDPTSSDPGMGGSDFSNEFTIQAAANQVYNNNAAQVYPPVPFIDPDPVIGCGNGIEIDITTSTSGCQTPLTYAWTGPNTYTGTSQDVMITPATTSNEGTYKVVITDALGCKDSIEIEAFTKPQAGVDQTVCAGTSASVSGTSPTTGTWSALPTNAPGWTINPGVDGNASIAFSTAASGVYSFKYTTPLCSDTMRITVNPKPIVGLGAPAICANLTTTLTSNQVGTWTANMPLIATVSGNVVTGVTSGLATFTFTNTLTGCQSTTTNLTVNPEPTVTMSTDSICIGSTSVLTPASGAGTWTSTLTSVATVNSATGIITGVAAGITKLVYRESLSPNCVSDTLTLTVLAKPITTLTGSNPICIGGTTTFTPISGGTWNSTDATIATITNGGLVTGVLSGTTTFLFTQSGTLCVSNPSTPITVQAKPTVGGVPATPRCIGTTLTLTFSPAGGTWVSNNLAVATVVAATGVVTTVGPGTVNFTYTTGTGCSNTTSNLVVSPKPTVSSALATICVGSSTTISPNPSLGTGTWTNLTPTRISRSGATVSGISAGEGRLLFTETATTCVSDTLKITVNPRPIINLTGNDSICVGSTTTFTPASGGSWATANGSIATISVAGVVTGVAPGFTFFTYTQSSTGCISDPSAPITVVPTPTVSITGLNSICIGNTTTLSPTTGGTWASSNASVATVTNAGVVTGVAPGFATFIFTDASLSCPSPATLPVTVNTKPIATIVDNTLCINQTTAVNPSSGGAWLSSDNAVATVTNAGVVTAVAAGSVNFTYTATGSNCPSDPVSATVIGKPTTSYTGPTTLCIGGTSSLSALPSGGTWASNNGTVASVTSGGAITALAAGAATFTYTNTDGCLSDATTALTVEAPPTLTHPTPFRLCIGNTLTVNANTTGTWTSSNTAVATVHPTTGLVTAIAAGTASFSFVSTTSCPNSIPTLLTVNAKPVITPPAITSICVGKTATYAPTSGGAWVSSNTSVASINNSGLAVGVSPGTTTFTFTQTSTGCPSDASGPLTVSAGPTIGAPAAPQICIGATTTIAPNPVVAGTWASSDATIATIHPTTGVITGIKAGLATFTFTDGLGCKSQASSSVVVVPKPTVTLAGPSNICITGTTQFTANTTGTWASSNSAIATIHPTTGLVTGVSAGTVTFQFTSTLGCAADVTGPITVGAPPAVGIVGDTILCIGNKSQLSPATGGTWASNNPKVASVNNDGVVTSLAPGFVTFTFTESGGGCSSAAATDTIDVVSCIDPDFNVTYVNIPVPGNVKTNDNVPSGTTYGPTATLTSSPATSTPAITINTDGTYTFTGNVVGVYTYLVPVCVPPKVTGCDLSLLTITVLDNLSPIKKPVANVDFATTTINVAVTLKTMANDRCVVTTDCTLDPASVAVIDNPNNGTFNVNTSTGDITYTPANGFTGMDTLTYTICVTGEPSNCATAYQIITVGDVVKTNSTVADDDFNVTAENVAVTGNVKTNDSDPEGDNQTVTAQTTTLAGGTLVLLSDGSYTFTPAPLFFGPIDFPYTTCDNNARQVCADATLHILVVPDLVVKIRAYLEGALMNTGTTSAPDGRPMMRDNLRVSPFNGSRSIPTKDPAKYVVTVAPGNPDMTYDLRGKFVEVGTVGQLTKYDSIANPSTVFAVTGQNAIVDWVFIELRSSTSNSTVLGSRAALIQRDGDVVDLDGINGLKFPGLPLNNYYVTVKHRNHFSVLSKNALTPAEYADLVDFTKPTFQTYDKGQVGAYNYTGLAQKADIRNGYMSMWAGDFDRNGKIKADNPNDDLNFLFNDVFSYPTNTTGNVNFDFAYGYLPGDYDLNGKAKFDNPNDDKNMLYGQLLFYPLNVSLLSNFDFFIEQLP